MQQAAVRPRLDWDSDKFRLRTFVNRLIEMGEVQVHEQPIALSALSPIIESTTCAHLFRQAGPEKHEVVAAVSASRKRLAAAFGVSEEKAREELGRRLANPQKAFEVPSDEAPVHEVIETGNQIDFTRLPFHLQHEYDGAPYISSGIDFTRDPLTGRNNVGARRLMLRGRDKCGINLTAPSDLRQIYLGCVERKERLPISFVVGSHPLYIMAAGSRGNPGDELATMATFRGEPLPVVKCRTNDLRVPADAEMVFEGYLDERGYIDNEGPYGEYMGFYGPMHGDPVFHCTAITRRRDVLHHSYKHGYGRHLGELDGAPMGMLQTELRAWQLLKGAGLDPVDVYAVGASGVSHHVRVSIRKRGDGDPRAAIAVLLGNIMTLKHVWITDDDINIRSHDEFEWAMSTRFQADKDLVILSNMREMPMDPSTNGKGVGSKAGFDCTFPFPRSKAVTMRVPEAAKAASGPAKYKTVREALAGGPMHFAALMRALGSLDGREIVLEIEKLRDAGQLDRKPDGEYYLKS
jgi:2,5-furandicarboxylate decarboxylase 1